MKQYIDKVWNTIQTNPKKVVIITAVTAVGIGLLVVAVRNGQFSKMMEEAPELIETVGENLA